jgi:hypothetical protein
MAPEAIQDLGVVVRITIGLAALVVAIQYGIRPLAAEYFRQDLFKLRRDLFIAMLDVGLPHSDPAHVRLRNTVNGLLRFAEHLGFVRLMLGMEVLGGEGLREHRERVEKLLNDVRDPRAREVIEAHDRALGVLIIKHVALVSPVLWLLMCFAVVLRVKKIAEQRLSRAAGSIEAEAEIEGEKVAVLQAA